eukprot:8518984-Pyramimonas_sp.AAC.1
MPRSESATGPDLHSERSARALALASPNSHSDAQVAHFGATVLRCAVCAWIRGVARRISFVAAQICQSGALGAMHIRTAACILVPLSAMLALRAFL